MWRKTAAGEWESYRVACGYFAPAQFWATTDESFQGGHYRCPHCGGKYAPWQVAPKLMPANKLMVIEACVITKANMFHFSCFILYVLMFPGHRG